MEQPIPHFTTTSNSINTIVVEYDGKDFTRRVYTRWLTATGKPSLSILV
jgi:hypothetical protein